MSEAKTTASLKSLSLEVRSNPEDSGESLYVAKDSGISMWTFHSVREDLYTLSATIDGETKYLKIDNTGLSMVDEQDASEIQFLPGTGDYAGSFRLTVNGKTISYEGKNEFKAVNDNGKSTRKIKGNY